MDPKLIISGILFLFLILSGMWLNLMGRPLNTIVFSLHKIIAISTIVLLVLSILNLQKGKVLQQFEIWAIVLSGLFILMAFVSGGLLSFETRVNNFTLMVHKLAPYVALVSLVIAVLFLNRT